MKIISYCLFDYVPLYKKHIEQNLEAAAIIYPDWLTVILIDETVPYYVIKDIHENYYNIIFYGNSQGYINQNKWGYSLARFCVDFAFKNLSLVPKVSDRFRGQELERYIVRDLDSRLSLKEKYAVDEWEESGRSIHTMRDNIAHDLPMCAGMWGATGKSLSGLEVCIRKYIEMKGTPYKGMDQEFLREVVWPIYYSDSFAHDSRESSKQFYCEYIKDFPEAPIPFGGFIGKDVREEEIDSYKVDEEDE